MKRLIILSIAFLSLVSISAQNGFHQHDGFYLSMALGSASGDIKYGSSNYSAGTSGTFDFKIGGAINENLILHATLTSIAKTGPKQTIGSITSKLSDNFSVGQAMLGAGLTYYTKSNFFLSGSVGSGNFSQISKNPTVNVSTDHGLALQLKLGKEWWVSKNWGLGVSAIMQSCSVSTKSIGITEDVSATQFGILFNATFN